MKQSWHSYPLPTQHKEGISLFYSTVPWEYSPTVQGEGRHLPSLLNSSLRVFSILVLSVLAVIAHHAVYLLAALHLASMAPTEQQFTRKIGVSLAIQPLCSSKTIHLFSQVHKALSVAGFCHLQICISI